MYSSSRKSSTPGFPHAQEVQLRTVLVVAPRSLASAGLRQTPLIRRAQSCWHRVKLRGRVIRSCAMMTPTFRPSLIGFSLRVGVQAEGTLGWVAQSPSYLVLNLPTNGRCSWHCMALTSRLCSEMRGESNSRSSRLSINRRRSFPAQLSNWDVEAQDQLGPGVKSQDGMLCERDDDRWWNTPPGCCQL